MDRAYWEARSKHRAELTDEERKLAALEDIADTLIQIEEALQRIADNVA